MVRILHCADVHLERRFTGATMTAEEATRRRAELRAALERIVDLALQHRVDALTIAGDLYEHEYATADTGVFLATQFQRLAPVPVLVAPGNHDPFVAGSLYQRVAWSDNVTVFDSSGWRPVRVADDVLVWGIGHDGPAMRRDALRELRLSNADTAVLLFHGADVSRPVSEEASQGPFQAADVKRSGAAFALLGHEHTWRLSRTFAYPGSPEPLGFFTEGPHYAMLATIQARAVRIEPVPVSRVTYQTLRVDVSNVDDAAGVHRTLGMLSTDIKPAAIVRIVFTGVRAATLRLEREALTFAQARRLRYVEVVDETSERALRVRMLGARSADEHASFSKGIPSTATVAGP
jgi:DNA repair exonuclease SbcCD nuclease subunit